MDSLYNEYPVGQILLWDTIDLPITKNLDGVKSPALPSAGRPKIVLDGQQRLTSLYLALSEQLTNEVEVCFNVDTEQFQLYLRRLDADPHWVKVRELISGKVDDFSVLEKLQNAGALCIGDETFKLYLQRLQKLKKVRDYQFPIEIFKSDDYEEVTELFVRINSAGTRLRMAELALAQLALRLPGAIVERFEKAIEEYEDAGFALDTRFLTRALIVIGTGQSRFRHLTEFWKKPASEVEDVWEAAHKGINAAVNFVRHNACFESSDWLPSVNAMIPLIAYFARHPRMTGDVENGLLKWFYVASVRGRYSRSGETALDEDLKAVAGETPLRSLMENLEASVSLAPVTPDEFDDAGWRNALFAMTYAAARKRRAKDWFTGIELSKYALGGDHEIQVHHVFPKALLKDLRVQRKDRDEIANLAFLAAKPNRQISKAKPEVYLAEIAASYPDRLEAQCIPMDPKLWKLDAFQDFLAERRRLLANAVNDLLNVEPRAKKTA